MKAERITEPKNVNVPMYYVQGVSSKTGKPYKALVINFKGFEKMIFPTPSEEYIINQILGI